MPTHSQSSGFRAFPVFVTSISGVSSIRWSPRFVWVDCCNREKAVRLSRVRLKSPPEVVGAFHLADLIGNVK